MNSIFSYVCLGVALAVLLAQNCYLFYCVWQVERRLDVVDEEIKRHNELWWRRTHGNKDADEEAYEGTEISGSRTA